MTIAIALSRLDADVHVRWPSDDTLVPRLPKSWRDRWRHGAGHTQRGLRIGPKYYNPFDPPSDGVLGTATGQAVADPETLLREWVEPQRLDAVVLSVYDAPLVSTFGDVDYPGILARAVNEWLAETWLDADPRLLGSITVATQDPTAAAAEIRRAAAHPRMVQVILPTGTRQPYGHRHFDPIHEAAAECGLALAIHAGTEGAGTSVPPSPNGWPVNLLDYRVTRTTAFLGHLTSLITEGVFVRHPQLRVIGLETGVAWLPTYLWRFDKNYKGLRSECPWLRELPSESVRRFFRFGTHGAEPAPNPESFWRLLRSVGADDLLLFASNYPRWDHETPDASFVLASCREDKRARVWSGAARETYPRLA